MKVIEFHLEGTPQSIPNLINLSYDTQYLRLSLGFNELDAYLNIKIRVEGFRVLDERELLEFWDPKTRADGWLWKIESGGWFDQECQREGFLTGLTATSNSKPNEYLVLSQDECVSILSYAMPQIDPAFTGLISLNPVGLKLEEGKNQISYQIHDPALTAFEFNDLIQRVWPGHFKLEGLETALKQTINITARKDDLLIAIVRLLTDGYLFATIPEILVDPLYQGKGVGKRLMELVWEQSPCALFFGAQPGKESFFEKLGFKPGIQSYQRFKERL